MALLGVPKAPLSHAFQGCCATKEDMTGISHPAAAVVGRGGLAAVVSTRHQHWCHMHASAPHTCTAADGTQPAEESSNNTTITVIKRPAAGACACSNQFTGSTPSGFRSHPQHQPQVPQVPCARRVDCMLTHDVQLASALSMTVRMCRNIASVPLHISPVTAGTRKHQQHDPRPRPQHLPQPQAAVA